MNSTGPSTRLPRKDSKYNRAELKVIGKYKEEYISETTKAGRVFNLRNQILPAMFTYWKSIGEAPGEGDESRTRAKELTDWLSNNWRMRKGLARASNNFKVKKSEVFWNLHQEDVLQEIAHLLGAEQADTTTPGWFPKRLPAIRNIIQGMSPEELAQLDVDVERINKKGYPDEVKKKLAEKYTTRRVKTNGRSNWMEMGVMSVTFTAYTAPDGKLVIDAHDHIAEITGLAATSFVASHKDQVLHMKRLFMQYIKKLQSTDSTLVPNVPTTCRNEDSNQGITLNRTSDGFPVLQNPWKITKYTKIDLEQLFSLYVSEHYKLANGGRYRHIPYKSISTNTSHYIAAECLPAEFVFNDPRNVRKEKIEDFFNHVLNRQLLHGPKGAFCFKAVKGKKGLQLAKYPVSAGADADQSTKAKRRTSKKRGIQSHQSATKNKNSFYDPISGPGPGAEVSMQDATNKKSHRPSEHQSARQDKGQFDLCSSEHSAGAEYSPQSDYCADAEHSPQDNIQTNKKSQINRQTIQRVRIGARTCEPMTRSSHPDAGPGAEGTSPDRTNTNQAMQNTGSFDMGGQPSSPPPLVLTAEDMSTLKPMRFLSPNGSTELQPTVYIIDQTAMDKLIKAGMGPVPMPVPINGPADGMPKYMIDAITQVQLNQLITPNHSLSQDNQKARQARLTADALALKEATSSMALPARSRKKKVREW